MFSWIKDLFRSEAEPPIHYDPDDNTMRVAMEAFRSGKTVIGNVDEDGKLTMEVLSDPDEQ